MTPLVERLAAKILLRSLEMRVLRALAAGNCFEAISLLTQTDVKSYLEKTAGMTGGDT